MILQFHFRSDPIESADLLQRIVARTAELIRSVALQDVHVGFDPIDEQRAWIRMSFDAATMGHSPAEIDSNDESVEQHVPILKAIRLARQVVQEFAGEASWNWAVGHEMESHLGTVSASGGDSELNSRLLETLHIAWSLAQLGNDDLDRESVSETSDFFDASTGQTVLPEADDAPERRAFYAPESFKRFPELD